MKKALALVLTLCILMTMASFPAAAASTNTKRVKIFTMGDSFTAGICEPNAYRYYIYENLIKDGGVFEFIGPSSSSDYRVTSLYNKHGGVGGAVIGYKDDVKWNGSGWSTNAWTVTTKNGVTMKYNGTKNSLYFRLFAGSDGSSNYAKTEYGSYVKDADIVIMYIGLNDYYSTGTNGITADIEHVKERYYTIVDRIYEINPNASLYVCSLNVVDYLRGYDLKPGDSGYANSVYKFNEFVLNDVVAKYEAKGYKIGGVDLNEPGFQMIVGVDNPSDDAHPNEKGNRKIGTQMYKAIKDEVLKLNQQTGASYNPTRVTSISIDKTSANLALGEDLTINATIAPSNAEIITTVFSSSDESVATVDINTGRVKAVGEGTATIYATALDSMRPGATEIKAACTVTVTSHEFQKTGESYLPALNENFLAAGAWTGNTSLIANSSKAYKHTSSSSSSSITTKTIYDLKESFSMSFRASLQGAQTLEINSSNKAAHYVSLQAGKYELRVALCGRVVSFYHNGSLVKEATFKAPAYRKNDDTYTLVKYKGTAYVYRNNECLFTADVDEYETVESKVTLAVKGADTITVRDVKVNSIYGLQEISASILNNTTMTNKVFDGSLTSRQSFSTDFGATTSSWTDSSKNSFVIDLGAVYDVAELDIYWGGHTSGVWGQTMPDAYNVSYSADNVTYTPAASYSGIHAYLKNGTATSIIDDTTYFSAVYPSWATGNDRATYSYGVVKETELDWTGVRYIKVQMTSVSYNPTVAEIDVFTKGFTESDEPDGVTTFYKVNYVDKNGKVLAEQKLVKDMDVGTIVTETAPEIEGYAPDAQSKTLELKSAGNTITFTYSKIYSGEPVAAKLTYLSRTGTYYLGSNAFERAVDGSYTTAWVSDQYKDPATDSMMSLVFELEETSTIDSLTLTWGNIGEWGCIMPNKYRVSVSEDNQSWKEIRAYEGLYDRPTSYPGYDDTLVYAGSESEATIGVTVTATDLNVRNVRYIKVEILNWRYRATLAEIEAVVIAGESEVVGTSYTVKYVDESGRAIADFKNGTGYVGDKVTEQAIKIEGYEISDNVKSITLGSDAASNTITFTYQKRKTVNYTVKYIDELGTAIVAENIGSGYVGDTARENAIAISGYATEENSKSITLVDGTNEIVFTYAKLSVGEVVKINPATYSATGVSFASGRELAKAFDGNASSSFKTNWYSGASTPKKGASANMNIYIDLGNGYNISKWVIEGVENTGYNFQAFAIYGSNDNSTWTEIADITNATNARTEYNISHQGTYRYLRFEGYGTLKNKQAVYSEIEIYGTAGGTSGGTTTVPEDTINTLGANIRLEAGDLSAGLRFGAEIDKEKAGIDGEYEYDSGSEVKFGMFMLPKDKLTNGQTLTSYLENGLQSAVNVAAKKVIVQNSSVVRYTAVLTNIPESAWGQVIVAVPYAFVNGNYIFFQEKEQSYAGVAKAAATAYENGNPNNLSEEQYETLIDIATKAGV